MSDQTLMALWCHLDLDDSNAIQMDEMGKFLRKWAAPKSTDASGPMQAAIMADYEDLAKLGATVSTLDIRAELAAGVSLPDGEELLSPAARPTASWRRRTGSRRRGSTSSRRWTSMGVAS